MSNVPPFSDSPRDSALYPTQSNEIPLQITQVTRSSDSQEPTSSDELLGAVLENTVPYLGTARNEPDLLATSVSAPSLGSQLIIQPISASLEGRDVKQSAADGSNGPSNSNQPVSFEEGNRSSAATPNHSSRTNVRIHPLLRETVSPAVRGVDSTVTKMTRLSDASRPSSAARVAKTGNINSPKKPGHGSGSPAPHSRATSPMRLFSWSGFHSSQPHEDAFVPIDPFRIRARLHRLSFHGPDIEHHIPFDPICEENPFCCFTPLRRSGEDRFLSFLQDTRLFFLDTLPRQIYLNLFFRFPSLYFSRIARVYEDAQLSKPDLERMIESYSSSRQREQRERIVRSSPIPPGAHYHPTSFLPFPEEWTTTNVSPALVRFKQSWEAFVDSLLREWKTLNLVSALLHSAILSMFQNQIMANDPVIRTAALLSLTSATMSLSYGCIYIIRFGTMRSMDKATRWAEEAARTTTFILWNVWVLLAMPAIWLAWSMIFFVIAILAFVWRYGSSTDPVSPSLLSPTAAIGPRIAISSLFFLGLVYLVAIVKTLRDYGKTTENRPSNGASNSGVGIPDTAESDARGGLRGSQRGRRTTQDSERNGNQQGRGRGSTRNGREQMETVGLSAVMGLGLRGLDEFANSRSSDEMLAEKQVQQTV